MESTLWVFVSIFLAGKVFGLLAGFWFARRRLELTINFPTGKEPDEVGMDSKTGADGRGAGDAA